LERGEPGGDHRGEGEEGVGSKELILMNDVAALEPHLPGLVIHVNAHRSLPSFLIARPTLEAKTGKPISHSQQTETTVYRKDHLRKPPNR
jgi:hypothetical protein